MINSNSLKFESTKQFLKYEEAKDRCNITREKNPNLIDTFVSLKLTGAGQQTPYFTGHF